MIEALDEPRRGTHLLLHEVLVLARHTGKTLVVQRTELQMGQPVVVKHDDEFIVVFVHEHVGAYEHGVAAPEARTWHGVERLYDIKVFLEIIHVEFELAQQRLVTAGFKVFEVVANEFDENTVAVVAQHFNLNQQTFLRSPRGNTYRVETLDGVQYRNDFGSIGTTHLCNVFDRSLKISRRADIADDGFTDALLVFCKTRKTQLPHEMPFKRWAGRIARLERGHLLGEFSFAYLCLPRRAGEFAKIVFPVGITRQFPVIRLRRRFVLTRGGF